MLCLLMLIFVAFVLLLQAHLLTVFDNTKSVTFDEKNYMTRYWPKRHRRVKQHRLERARDGNSQYSWMITDSNISAF